MRKIYKSCSLRLTLGDLMTKTYGTCQVCNRNRFLNFTGLCKRCNNDKRGYAIREKAFEQREQRLEQSEKKNPLMDELEHLWAITDPNEHQLERIKELEEELGVKKPEPAEEAAQVEKEKADSA